MPRHALTLVLLILSASGAFAAATQGGALGVPLPLFPDNNWWNTDVSSAPALDGPTNTTFITYLGGSNRQVHPDFGGDAGDGTIYGIPYVVVDSSQTKKSVIFEVPEESDGVNHATETSFAFYPIPDEAITQFGWIEYGPPGWIDARDDADRHILIVDKTSNHLYEIYNVWHNGTNWEAFSGAFFDMNTNNRRPNTWTSADASGMAILPGLVRYDEVYGDGEIRHAFRVTVSGTNNTFVYPASHQAGRADRPIPMGARLRLKASTNISGYPAPMQKIFRAMKKYGLIVADNGSNMYVSGTYDTRWNNDILNPAFHALKASDFEFVQLGWKPDFTFILRLPANVGSGDSASATLTVYDANDKVATGYSGTVQFTSTDAMATLPANFTFTPGDAGVHTFPASFVFRTAGAQHVTITQAGNPAITGSRGIVVGPPTPGGGARSRLVRRRN